MSMKNKIKVGVVGASGYTGSELLRLLVNHHNVEIVFAYSNTNNCKSICDIFTDLIGDIELKFTNTAGYNCSAVTTSQFRPWHQLHYHNNV